MVSLVSSSLKWGIGAGTLSLVKDIAHISGTYDLLMLTETMCAETLLVMDGRL